MKGARGVDHGQCAAVRRLELRTLLADISLLPPVHAGDGVGRVGGEPERELDLVDVVEGAAGRLGDGEPW